jgi:hypothetical protein
MTPILREILDLAKKRVLQLEERGYRPIAAANWELRDTLQIDERAHDRYYKACLLVEIAAGTVKDPANLYKLDKDELVSAIDKALAKGKVKA